MPTNDCTVTPPRLPPGVQDSSRLASLASTRLMDTPGEERFDALTRLACRLFDVPVALVSLVDDERQWFKSAHGTTLRETPVGDAFCAYAVDANRMFVVEDAHQDPCFSNNPLVTGPPYIRFYAGAPIYGPGNMPLGTFCILGNDARQLSDHEGQVLQSLARLVTLEIAHRQNSHWMAKVYGDDEALAKTVGALVGHAEQRPIATLLSTLEELRTTLDATLDLVLIFDEQSQRFTYGNQGALEQLGYSDDELRNISPAHLFDLQDPAEFEANLAPLHQAVHSVRLNATLRRHNGELLPVQAVIQRIKRQRSGRMNYVIVARDQQETLAAQREIDWVTHHDPLTRQLNRAGFLRELEHIPPQYTRQAPLQTILVCGIDRFKRLNDAHGTQVADDVLFELAETLALALVSYPNARLARLGGDEFAIGVNLANDSNARLLADGLRQQVEQHRFQTVKGLQLTMSVGQATATDGQAAPEELLRRANAALVLAKRHGRNRVRQYQCGMLDEASRHQVIERRLSGAFERGDFYLHFQPQWQLSDLSRPIGAEVLLRWQDEELGIIGPDVFIPILEESGMMLEVGRWVIEQALDHLAEMRARLPLDSDFFISLNVSAVQLMDDARLADWIVEDLRQRQLPARALELEITETALIQSPDWISQQLDALCQQGIRIALDDFGTGFSSLSHLKQFPFDTVKIDKSFIAGLPDSTEDRAIVESLLTLCRGFGRHVCAEGIETPAQLDFLRRFSCDRAQGYLLARPGPELTAAGR